MKIINENLLPETLTEKDFDRWNESFFGFIESHFLFTAYELDNYKKFDYKEALGDLSIEISLETPTSEYGLYSSEEIKEIAKNIIKNNVSNPNQILSDIDKVEDIDVEKIDFIYRHNRSEEFECVLHKIYELINEKKHTELVFGEYVIGENEHNKKDGKIILYLNNIKKECSSNIIEKIEQTYIHEFFHHFHNCVSFGGNNIEEFSHRNDYPSIVIKESLAKFFELNYMKFYYSFNYNEKIEELRQYVVSAYPYSGATYIKDGYDIISNKSYDCFIEFSKLYIMSFDEALSYLLSNNEEEYKKVLEHDNKYKSILTGIRKKDYSKYKFEGKIYNKRRIVLAIVKAYVRDNNIETFDDLVRIFPPEFNNNKSNGVVKRPGEPKDISRYFHGDDTIKNSKGEEIALVSNQWGIGNVEDFINKVKIILKSDVKKC